MERFGVWAPSAHRVELELAAKRIPMEREPNGWWSAEDGADEYAFVLDGGDPLPDPRSPWQPFGVHGPSRKVDHSAFRWTDGSFQQRPLASGLIYELHVGTFTPEGTFDSAIERLRELGRLGVTHVELMPVAEFPGARGWGYDGVALYAPHHAYGGPEGLKRLVNACHANGQAVILDVVYNHLGPTGNYLPQFGPYFTERHRTPWGPAVNFDGPGSEEVRRFFLDNAAMWLRDYHIDALRVDAVHAIVDTSALHFLEDLARRVGDLEIELGRRLALIAESDLNDPRIVTERAAGGYGFDAQWSDDFHHALHALLTGERAGYYADFGRMEHLARALRNNFVYDGCYSKFRGRAHGRSAAGLPATRFVAFAQNHDQVGNRALGERSAALLTPGRRFIAAAVLLLSPFVPMLFQGEEWGASTPFLYFTDHSDPEIAAAVSRGRREEFPHWEAGDIPDPQAPATFERSRLKWEERGERPHRELLEWHEALMRLRAQMPEVRVAPVELEYDEARGVFAMRRGAVQVTFNIGAEAARFAAPRSERLLLTSSPEARLEAGQLVLPPDSVAITAESSSSDRERLLACVDDAATPVEVW